MAWLKLVPVGPKGEDGEQGLPGQGSGTVNKVNGIEPDETGNVKLSIPPEPDLNGLTTNQEFQAHETKIASPTVLGHVKVGQNLSIEADGTLNASGGAIPDASTTVKGIVKLNGSLTSTSTTEAATANAVKQLNDLKVDKTQENWITLVLSTGWFVRESLQVMKDSMGFIHLQGRIRNNDVTPYLVTEILATLPVGYRPSRNVAFAASVTSATPSVLVININGQLVIGASDMSGDLGINVSFRELMS